MLSSSYKMKIKVNAAFNVYGRNNQVFGTIFKRNNLNFTYN